MRIMYIAHSIGLEGANQSLLNIIAKMEESKAEIYVVAPRETGALIDRLKAHKVNVIIEKYFPWRATRTSDLKRRAQYAYHWLRWRLLDAFVNQRSAERLAQIVLEKEIDVIHTNCSTIDIGARMKAILLRKGRNVRHVWHLREFGDKDFDQYYLPSRRTVTARMNKYTDRFICISKAIYNHYDYLEKEKKQVIYNGVPVVEANAPRAEDGVVNLLIAGRVGVEKGQDIAVAACKRLDDAGIHNVELHLAGKGQLKKEIPDSIRERVHLLGFVDNMRKLREKVDIELVCSRSEAFGRVTAEAMMCGIPVVGTRSGGTPELIDHGKTGFLFDYGDDAQLADILAQLIRDPELRARIGEAGRNQALQNYTIEKCVNEISKLYDKLL